MNKTGTLQSIQGNIVMIDGTYYDASAIAQYLPKETDITVEFNADDNNVLQFLKKKSVSKRQPYTSKNTTRPTFTPKNTNSFQPNYNDKRNESIIKQVIFKAAVEERKLNPQKSLFQIYQELKNQFMKELM